MTYDIGHKMPCPRCYYPREVVEILGETSVRLEKCKNTVCVPPKLVYPEPPDYNAPEIPYKDK